MYLPPRRRAAPAEERSLLPESGNLGLLDLELTAVRNAPPVTFLSGTPSATSPCTGGRPDRSCALSRSQHRRRYPPSAAPFPVATPRRAGAGGHESSP